MVVRGTSQYAYVADPACTHTYAPPRIEMLGRWGSLSFPRRGALREARQAMTRYTNTMNGRGACSAKQKKKTKTIFVLCARRVIMFG